MKNSSFVVRKLTTAVICAAMLLTVLALPAAAETDGGEEPEDQSSAESLGETTFGALVEAGHDGYEIGVVVDKKVLDTEKELESGEKQYSKAFEGVELIAKQDDLTFTVVAILADEFSEHKLSFELSMPNKATLSLLADGSVAVLTDQGVPVGLFKQPWARDANGDEVKTYFELDGSTLIQHVDSVDPSAYPVYADPDFDAGYFSSTIYFNRSETSVICSGGIASFGAFIRSGVASFVTGPLVAAIVAAAATVVGLACSAEATSRCLKIKLIGHVIPVPLIYRNSTYCN